MGDLATVAPAFVGMAHATVWATVATVDRLARPRTRILHPIWEWDGSALVGWIATRPTPVKRVHIEHSPFLSITYWAPSHDTCIFASFPGLSFSGKAAPYFPGRIDRRIARFPHARQPRGR